MRDLGLQEAVNCEEHGMALTQFKIMQSKNLIWFDYYCLKPPSHSPFSLGKSRDFRTQAVDVDSSLLSLSSLNVSCQGSQMLSSWKLRMNRNEMGHINYQCTDLNGVENTGCTEHATNYFSVGLTVGQLSSENIVCPADTLMQGWSVKSTSLNSRIQFIYTCCSFDIVSSQRVDRFTNVVYILFALCVAYILYDTWNYKSTRPKYRPQDIEVPLYEGENGEVSEEKNNKASDEEIVHFTEDEQLKMTQKSHPVVRDSPTVDILPFNLSVEEGVVIGHAFVIPESPQSRFTTLCASFFNWLPPVKDIGSNKFEALATARYIASMHIVLGHMYQSGHLSDFRGFNLFGYTWVPWFFVLSGFVLTTSEISRRNKNEIPVSISEYIIRRLEALYPIYALGLFASVVTVWALQGASALPSPQNVMLYASLLQSWVPSILESGFPYLVQCWFLSCLIFYWLIFYKIYDFLHPLSDTNLLLVSAACASIIPALYEVIGANWESWYDRHAYESNHHGVDVAVLVIKYHPFMYTHIFVLGCTLARVRKIIRNPSYKIVWPYLTSLSYLCLLVLFCCGGEHIPGYKLSLRIGLISIFQSTLLLGLCNPEDIITRIFSLPFLVKLGQFSFPQYVFQFMVYAWFHAGTSQVEVDIRFFLLLFTTSAAVATVMEPVSYKKNLSKFCLFAAPLLIAYSMMQPYWVGTNIAVKQGSSTKVIVPHLPNTDLSWFGALPPWLVDSPLKFQIKGILYMHATLICSP